MIGTIRDLAWNRKEFPPEYRAEIIADEERLQGYSSLKGASIDVFTWLEAVAQLHFRMSREEALSLTPEKFMVYWRVRVDLDYRPIYASEKAAEKLREALAIATGKQQ